MVATLVAPTGAFAAADDNFVNSLDLDLTQSKPVRITSSDGETYDSIEAADIGFLARLGIDLRWPGALTEIGIHLGECTGHHGACYTKPLIFYERPSARDLFTDRPFTRSSGGTANTEIMQAMFAKCNSHKDAAEGTSSDVLEQLDVGATLAVHTDRDLGKLDPNEPSVHPGLGLQEYSKTKSFPFKLRIACAPLPQMSQAGPKPVSVDIRVKQNGNTCPKDTDVTAYIDYDKPITARFRVIHNGKQSKPIEIKARMVSLAGKTFYRIERLERYKLDPGKHSFRIKVIGGGKSKKETIDVDCPPFEVSSAWLNYKIENKETCPKMVTETATIYGNRPGDAPYRVETQGGLVVAQGIAYTAREGDKYVARRTRKVSMGAFDQMMRLVIPNNPSVGDQKPLKLDCLEVLSGTLELRTFADTACKGEAALSIHTNQPGKVPYKLDCTGGKTWNRSVDAMSTGPNTFLAVDTVRFDVENGEQVNCALKTRKPMDVKILTVKGHKYTCHEPIDVGGADDLVPETRPEEPPLTPKLTGDFTFIDNGGTKCPRGRALISFKNHVSANVHYSLDCTNGSFSGVAKPVVHPNGGFVAAAMVDLSVNKTGKVNCALKTVAPGKPKVHTLKGHAFQCVKTTGVTGSDDLTPDTRPDPKKPDGPKIVAEPLIGCVDGQVNNGICICPSGHKRTVVGKNAWRCVKTATIVPPKPKISCAGGRVKNGTCQCSSKYKPVKASQNAWRCVRVVADPPRNKDKATIKTAPKKTAKPKSGAGKKTRLKANGKAAQPAILLAPSR